MINGDDRMLKPVLALLLAATPVAASAMSVSEFLAKVEALKKMGMKAMFSKDVKLLRAEIKQADTTLRAEQTQALQAGRKPDVCMPKKLKSNAREFMAHFEAIPPAQRGISVKAGYATFIKKKNPCPR